jgi:hypothetical protein
MWLWVATSVGLVGCAIFSAWLVTVARGYRVGDDVGSAVLTIMLVIGVTEMPIYAGALLSVVFLLLIPPLVATTASDQPHDTPIGTTVPHLGGAGVDVASGPVVHDHGRLPREPCSPRMGPVRTSTSHRR